MKHIHKINKILIIINLILGLTIYFGLLFLIPLGIVQIIMSVIIAFYYRKLTNVIRLLLIIYCSITALVLISLLYMYLKSNDNQGLFILSMCISVGLAFLHLKITYMIDKIVKPRIES